MVLSNENNNLTLNQPAYVPPVGSTGTLQAEGTSVDTLAVAASVIDDFYTNAFIEITGGGITQNSKITNYVGATRIATISPTLSQLPPPNSTYNVFGESGTVSSPTRSSQPTIITLDGNQSASVVVGTFIEFTSGIGGGQIREILAINGNNITVDILSPVPVVGDRYTIFAGWGGSYDNVSNFSEITNITNLSNGQEGLLVMKLGIDGKNEFREKIVAIGNTNTAAHTLVVVSEYFLIKIVSREITPLVGSTQTLYHKEKSKELTSFINETIGDTNDCSITRSVITGRTAGGMYDNVSINTFGNLEVAIADPTGAFGSLKVTNATPTIQAFGLYNHLNDQDFSTVLTGTSSINLTNNLISLSLGAGANSTGIIKSRRAIRYRPGQSATARMTAIFDTPTVLTRQGVGLVASINGESLSGYSFGFEDLLGTNTFGIIRSTGGINDVHSFQVTTAATGPGAATVTLDGVAFTVTLKLSAATATGRAFTANEIALQVAPVYIGNGWRAEAIGDTVFFISETSGPKVGAFSYAAGATGSAVTVTAETTGVTTTRNFTPQILWNVDQMDGTGSSGQILNPQRGNVYEIKFQWLGFGAITYSIESQNTGKLLPVHIERYANANLVPSVTIPHLSLSWSVESLGATTNKTIQGGSCGGFVDGIIRRLDPKFSHSRNVINLLPNTEVDTPIFTLVNKNIYNNGGTFTTDQFLANFSEIQFLLLSVASDSTKPVTIKLFVNATVGNDLLTDFHDFSNINIPNSAVAVDESALTTTGGTLITSIGLGATGSQLLNLKELDLLTGQFESLTITGATTNANNDVTVTLIWVEDH